MQYRRHHSLHCASSGEMPTEYEQGDRNLKSTEWWQATTQIICCLLYWRREEHRVGRHGDTVQLEAENAANTDEDKEWTRKMIDEGGAKK